MIRSRILQNRGLQLGWITASEICIIFHIILSLLQHYSFITDSKYFSVLNKLYTFSKTFFKSFTYFLAHIQDISRCCFLQILLKTFITSIKKYVLHILAFLQFSLIKNSAILLSRIAVNPVFVSSRSIKQLGCPAWK